LASKAALTSDQGMEADLELALNHA
jgi:hypothetical protein